MARLGLGSEFEIVYANDFAKGKAACYEAFFGDRPDTRDLVEVARAGPPVAAVDLIWASFPCQDWSEAGWKKGVNGRTREAYDAMFGFIDQVETKMIVFENVRGLLTTDNGIGMARLASDLSLRDFNFTAHQISSVAWLPQSRPRVFVTAWKGDVELPQATGIPSSTTAERVCSLLQPLVSKRFFRSSIPEPVVCPPKLVDILEPVGTVSWLPKEEVDRLTRSAKLPVGRWMDATPGREANGNQREGYGTVGTGFRRTRKSNKQTNVVFEPRFDGVAGCLRASEGGSSRQFVINVVDGDVAIRRMTPREGARLMGIPDQYQLPKNEGSAWRLVGDGVCVPVVAHIREHLICPILKDLTCLHQEEGNNNYGMD